MHSWRRLGALAVLGFAAAAIAATATPWAAALRGDRAAAGTADAAVRGGPGSAVVSIERDGLRYEYHAPSGSESLWAAGAAASAPENLIASRPADARRLRRLLEAALGVGSLTELRAAHAEGAARLRALGYL